ncbi:MAG TPA: protein translocase subunit SecD [Ktedonosporobacter sp.]|nr:protein translocase subunit SecD [Ktedonosporobacter sp.]
MRRGTTFLLLLILALTTVAAYVNFWPNPDAKGQPWQGINNPFVLREGLDIQGGRRVLLIPDPNQHYSQDTINKMINEVRNQIEQRVNNGLGVKEPSIRVQTINGQPAIAVELPGLNSGDQAADLDLLRKTGNLEFWSTGPDHVPLGSTFDPSQYAQFNPNATALFTGKNLDPQQISVDILQDGGYPDPVIHFSMQGDALQRFSLFTSQNVGSNLTITLDRVVIESATIDGPINGPGMLDSKGHMTLAEAQRIATTLRYGALPLVLKVDTEDTVGPTLGQETMVRCALAGVIGVGIVCLYMLAYYRLLGLLADGALLLYALLTFAVFKVIGATMTLAGIAGFVLSIGMAVDANILVFERIKEELREGRGLSAAIESGWKRAWPSIRDSNVATMITCAVLYYLGNNFGTSMITGFATTLFLGVAISMFTAIVVTRTFLNALLLTGAINYVTLGLPINKKKPSSTRSK